MTARRQPNTDPYYLQSEDQFQSLVTDEADRNGLLWYHPNQPDRDRDGWPDLAIACPAQGALYLWELKTMRGRLRPAQVDWNDVLQRCWRLEYGLYRPSDWPILRDKLAR